MNNKESFSLAYCIVYKSRRLPKEICNMILEYMPTPANLLKKSLRENEEIKTAEDLVKVCSKRYEIFKGYKKIASALYAPHPEDFQSFYSTDGIPLITPITMAVKTYIPRDIMLYMLLNKKELLHEIADESQKQHDTFYHEFYFSRPKHSSLIYYSYENIRSTFYKKREYLTKVIINLTSFSYMTEGKYWYAEKGIRIIPNQYTENNQSDWSKTRKIKYMLIHIIDEIAQATMRPHNNLGVCLFKNIKEKYSRLGVKKLYQIWRRIMDEDLYDILGINN